MMTLDGAPVDIQTIQVLCFNNFMFASNKLAAIDNFPQAVHILDKDNLTADKPILIDVKVLAAHDRNEVSCQFYNGADARVNNLLVYVHNYKPYNLKLKCPVWLTSAAGSDNIYPLGEGKLHAPAAVPGGNLAICCLYSLHLSSILISSCCILKPTTCWNKDFSGQDMRSFFFADGNSISATAF